MANEALYYYKECLKHGNFYTMINIGDIYLFGLDSLKPNYYKAYLYYTNFIKIKNNKIKYVRYVEERLKQLYNILYVEKDLLLDKDELNNNIDNYLLNIINEEDDIHNNVEVINIQNNIQDNNIYDDLIYNINDNNIYYDILNDPQNIHDTGVNNTVKNSITNLEINTIQEYTYDELKIKFLESKTCVFSIIAVFESVPNCFDEKFTPI